MPEENEDIISLDEVNEGETEKVAEEEPKEAGAKEGENPPKKVQDRQTNAEFAKRRREAEAAAKEKAEKENHQAFVKGKIAGIGGTNPYTNQPIEDEADLHQYELMKQADEQGKDPKEAYFEMARKERIEEAKRKAEQEQKEKDGVELAKKNIAEFETSHPDANFKELYEGNAKFKTLLDKGFHPNEAYDFLGLKPKAAPKPAPTPSSEQQGTAKGKSVKEMSKTEFDKYWEDL